jgi:hypothetical protein
MTFGAPISAVPEIHGVVRRCLDARATEIDLEVPLSIAPVDQADKAPYPRGP